MEYAVGVYKEDVERYQGEEQVDGPSQYLGERVSIPL